LTDSIKSPEQIHTELKSKDFKSRLKRFFLRRFRKLILKRNLSIWKHHADNRKLDWDWGKIKYNRIAVVNLLISKCPYPQKYLEIGCAGDALFSSVPVLDKIGVDPNSGGNYRTTSDKFFAQNTEKFDVIFIDGLHTYEQVRKDVINALKSLKIGGWIALHDMLPRDWIEQHVPIISQGAWAGDVWKIAFELAQTEGIEFKLLKIDHGVGVVRMINKDVQLVNLQKDLSNQQFSYYYDNLGKLPLLDWNEAEIWLHN